MPAQRKPIIAFFNPSDPENSYWPPIFDLMKKAASDLDFTFLHYDLGAHDRLAAERKIKEVLESKLTPDAIMASTTINSARRILDSPQTIRSKMIFEGPLFPSELKTLRQNAQKTRANWMGLFEQDEVRKGYTLAMILIEQARKQKAFAKDGKIHILGVGGTHNWYGSALREKGLRNAVFDSNDVVLNQFVPANWSTDKARELSLKMLNRFPETSIIWSASDQMAEGALQAFRLKGRKPMQNAFIGGLDLSEIGLKEVERGNFVATVGSPSSFYVKVAIYLYDTVMKSIDPEQGIFLTSEVYAATSSNISEFKNLKAIENSIDYKDFSIRHNPELKSHDFSWPTLIKSACKNRSAKTQTDLSQFCSSYRSN